MCTTSRTPCGMAPSLVHAIRRLLDPGVEPQLRSRIGVITERDHRSIAWRHHRDRSVDTWLMTTSRRNSSRGVGMQGSHPHDLTSSRNDGRWIEATTLGDLLGLSVKAGDPVGILLSNCAGSIASLFGAAKFAAIPVHPPVTTEE
jgi:hypothetical protein